MLRINTSHPFQEGVKCTWVGWAGVRVGLRHLELVQKPIRNDMAPAQTPPSPKLPLQILFYFSGRWQIPTSSGAQRGALSAALSFHHAPILPWALPANGLPHTAFLLLSLFPSKLTSTICIHCHNSHVLFLNSLLSHGLVAVQYLHLAENLGFFCYRIIFNKILHHLSRPNSQSFFILAVISIRVRILSNLWFGTSLPHHSLRRHFCHRNSSSQICLATTIFTPGRTTSSTLTTLSDWRPHRSLSARACHW